MTISNPAFCFVYFTGAHFRGKLQHVGNVSEQKIKCRPIRTREIGSVTLSDVLYARDFIRRKTYFILTYICAIFTFFSSFFRRRRFLFSSMFYIIMLLFLLSSHGDCISSFIIDVASLPNDEFPKLLTTPSLFFVELLHKI